MRVLEVLRALALVMFCLFAQTAMAQSILFSTAQPVAVDGPNGPGTTQLADNDVVSFNPASGIETIQLLDDVINDGGLSDMNALYATARGTIIFSVQSGTATYPFDDDIWVRSISVLPNGNLLLSAFNSDTGGTMTLGGQTFGRGDLVEYNRDTGVGSLFVSSSIFGGATEDFDAVHVIPLPSAALLLVSALGFLGWFRTGELPRL